MTAGTIGDTNGQGIDGRWFVVAPQFPTATVRLATHPVHGRLLADAQGRTLYASRADERDASACLGACAITWLPLRPAGTPVLPVGLGGTLDVIARPDGTRQVTYDGRPLYTHVRDTAPGMVNGHGVDGLWSVVAPRLPVRPGATRIWTDRPEYRVGDTIEICYSVPAPGPIAITDILPGRRTQVLVFGVDDGRGGCLRGTVTPPTGVEHLRLDLFSADFQVIATVETSFTVLP